MGKSKTETKNDPWAPAQPYILNNLRQTQDTYDRNQPQLQQFADDQRATYGRVASGAEAGVSGAQSLVNRNLSGENLRGNPFLDAILNKTRANVTGAVNDEFGMNGRFGSGMHAKILSDSLAAAENQARYQDYGVERGYQQDGIGQAQGLMGGAQGLLNNAAELPWLGVNASNGGIRQASNGYGTQTTIQRPNAVLMALQAGAQAAQTFAMSGSDRRLKHNIECVGTLPDGLPVYDFDYRPAPNAEIAQFMASGRQRGVMADEVAALRPWALGPVIGGYASVNYGAL